MNDSFWCSAIWKYESQNMELDKSICSPKSPLTTWPSSFMDHVCSGSNLPCCLLSQWERRGLAGPAPAARWGPTQEEHYLTEQNWASSAPHRHTHHLHCRPPSLVWRAWGSVKGGLCYWYDFCFSFSPPPLIFLHYTHEFLKCYHTWTPPDNIRHTLKNTHNGSLKCCLDLQGCVGAALQGRPPWPIRSLRLWMCRGLCCCLWILSTRWVCYAY